MKWDHKGIEITMSDIGTFFATVGPKELSSTSLASIKKKIADALAVEFKEFKSLRFQSEGITVMNVVGIDKRGRSDRYGNSEKVFITESTKPNEGWMAGREADVVPDTPEARAAIKRWQAVVKENQRLKEERDKVETDARAAIPSIRADDYKP